MLACGFAGVMGKEASAVEESFADGLLEYPQYTRPPVFEGEPIPEVLIAGDHAKIAAWRRAEAERITRERAGPISGRPTMAREASPKPAAPIFRHGSA